jgi:PAS domain-containing protein
MTENDADRQIVALRAEIESLRELLRQRGIEAADYALAGSQKDFRYERELLAERLRTAQADLRADAEGERADKAVAQHAELSTVHAELLSDTEFSRQVLENSTDCIKVLGLDGRLEFMSAGGMRAMEIDDFSKFRGCPWGEFWHGEFAEMFQQAVTMAKAGSVGRFQGQMPTAKGNMRWWEVVVSPISGADGDDRRKRKRRILLSLVRTWWPSRGAAQPTQLRDAPTRTGFAERARRKRNASLRANWTYV